MIQVDTKDLQRLVKELKLAHRSKYPNTVRFTLNDLAFDAKMNTIPKAFLNQSGYTIRKPAFVKAFTTVKKATGYEVSTMYSQAGFSTDKAGSKGQKNAVNRMRQQDEGGSVKSENIPLKKARKGEINTSTIQSKHFWRNIKNKNIQKVNYGNRADFVKEAMRSADFNEKKEVYIQYGRYVYFGFYKKVNNRARFLLKKIYDSREGRSVSLTAKHFTNKAAQETGAKLDTIFTKNAERQLAKFK